MALTSHREEVFLLDGGVQLERQLRRGAQKRLDDRGALEGVPVSGQRALRLADLPLHGRPLPLLQADLPGDGDVRLLPLTCLEVNHQSLETPEEAVRERGRRWVEEYFTPAEGGGAFRLSYRTPHLTLWCLVSIYQQLITVWIRMIKIGQYQLQRLVFSQRIKMTDIFFLYRHNTDLIDVLINHSQTNTSTSSEYPPEGSQKTENTSCPGPECRRWKESLGVVLLMFAR